ncbi:oxidoreductase family protein [Desmospora activa DSM 45169]|uniref:Oxidoreductase family protein n=2 Tax=Desmospora TaxID=500614 RepID=A0A2T4Z3W8_9BACL|nr:Gfo/Idh/MocA family oxidoreductase [Desmospora activa]PTM56566.1 oxidoreductase family protein [Desmospora activa DSM 45169]
MSVKKYAVCGVSNRAMSMFIAPMLERFGQNSAVVALLDRDPRRHEVCKHRFSQLKEVPEFAPQEFEQMIAQTKPDVLIVTGRDDTHADYIVNGLTYDLDILTEKPMTTTAADCRRILAAEKESKGRVMVAFNYRYSPIHTKIKEMVMAGKLGRITSVDLNWYIDTYHGSSYFQRWNRMRTFSGGLSIHKSSHHFDLVHWWLDQKPVEVFAHGALHYYGPEGEWNPRKAEGRVCATCTDKLHCAYYRRWNSRSQHTQVEDDHLSSSARVAAAEQYSDYRPDQCMFDGEIDIEDTYTATIKYDGGALLSYSINFSLPYEGYRLAINGTKGRLETTEYHVPNRVPFPFPEQTVDYFPLFGSKEIIHVVKREGGHGGGDPVLQEDLFLGDDPARPYRILSNSEDGALAVATGEAVWRSVKEHRPVSIAELLQVEGVQSGSRR